MSVRDLLKIAILLREKYPNYYNYFLETEYTWNEISQPNRNPLLNLNLGVDGLKTGHTTEADNGLVASEKLGERRVTFVIAGTNSKEERKLEGENYCNGHIEILKLLKSFPKKSFFRKGAHLDWKSRFCRIKD